MKKQTKLNEAKSPVKIGDVLYLGKRKGKVTKVMSDMANVDFGKGDVYGITFSRIKGDKIDEGKLAENKLLKQDKLSSAEYQKAKKLKGFDPKNYMWDPKQGLYLIRKMSESVVTEASKSNLKKGDKFKSTQTGEILFIIEPKGDGYDYRRSSDPRSKTHAPKAWFDMMIKTGKLVAESVLRGQLAGDSALDMADLLRRYGVKKILKQPNSSVTYLQLTDKNKGKKVVSMLKMMFGIEAQIDNNMYSPTPAVKFDNDQIAESKLAECNAPDGYHYMPNGELMKDEDHITEGLPIPMDTPNEFAYLDFKKHAIKNQTDFKKDLEKANGDGGKMFLIASAIWYKWARQYNKEFTHIKDKNKFGRALLVLMMKDNLIIKKGNKLTDLK